MKIPLRHPITWAALILAIATLILAFLPLFRELGYESSAVIGALFGLVWPPAVVHLKRQSNQAFWPGFGEALAWGMIVALLPLAILLANALRVPHCTLLEGLAFYLVIPGVTVFYVTSAATFWATLLRRRALLGYYLHLLGSLLLLAINLIFQPPLFAYQSLFGFYPGPIYDRRVTLSLMLLLARGITLLFGITLVWAASLIQGAETPSPDALGPLRGWIHRLRHGPWNRADVLRHGALAALLIACGIVFWFQDDWGFRPTRGSIQRALGGRLVTKHFVIYYDRLSPTADRIEQIARDHEFRYMQLVRFFGLQPTEPIRSYIYASADQKKRLMGARYTSIADPINREIHLQDAGFPHPILKHELAHVFATYLHPVLRATWKVGVHEGIAVAAEWDDGELTVHQWARGLLELGFLPPLSHVMSAWGFWTQLPARSYTAAGSFIRFLVDRYGMDAFRVLYATGNFSKAYGKSLNALEQAWRAFLRTVPFGERERTLAEHRFTRPSLFAQPCAHAVADRTEKAWVAYGSGNYRRATAIFERLRRWDPQNPRHLRGLVVMRMAQGDRVGARQAAEELQTHPHASRQLVGFARKRLGDLAWLAGDTATAERWYREVLAMGLSTDDAREMTVKLYALRSPHERTFREVLVGRADVPRRFLSEGARVARLEAILAQSADPIAAYLIGRLLFFDEDYAQAVVYLDRARAGYAAAVYPEGVEATPVLIETLRLLALSYFHLGAYERAREVFKAWANQAPGLADRERAQDWIERCTWELTRSPQSAPQPAAVEKTLHR